ncbi:unnamed protein product [Polarella glacialis]|uniref:Glycosyl transferase family 25 domain-containing protein n=1 Tax=Polarella glacialis TaxID=89957 RepID=A0A813LNW8_POLGL|nr:unnamed protein product [Polarella glacialis]CAE8739235.1 unnamed protein product [Polarella glacialis]
MLGAHLCAGQSNAEPQDQQVARWSAYLINLEHRKDRARRTGQLLEASPEILTRLRRVSAVDGRQLDPSALQHQGLIKAPIKHVRGTDLAVQLDKAHMTSGSLGCALSHLTVWREVLSDSAPWALVLEDDLIAVAPDLERRMLAVVDMLPAGWDLCFIGFHGDFAFEFLLSGGAPVEASPRVEAVEVLRGQSDWDLLNPCLGTFGYLVSCSGAAKLSAEGAANVFPLERQLDQQLNRSIADGLIKAFAVPEREALVFSPPFHCGDSDVQAPWGPSPALASEWQAHSEELQAAVRRQLAALDKAAESASGGCGRSNSEGPKDLVPDIARWLPARPRRCVLFTLLLGSDKDHAGRSLRQLFAAAASLRRHNSDVPVLVLLHGEDPTAACEFEASLACFPNVVVICCGRFEDRVRDLFEESAGHGCKQDLCHLTAERLAELLPLVGLRFCQHFSLDQLLLADISVSFHADVNLHFENHRAHDVYLMQFVDPEELPHVRRRLQSSASLSPCSLFNAEAWLRLTPWLQHALCRQQRQGFEVALAIESANLEVGDLDASTFRLHRPLPEQAMPVSQVSQDHWPADSLGLRAQVQLLSVLLRVPLELLQALDW